MSCPLARPIREPAVSSDHLSHFLLHLGLPLLHRTSSLQTVLMVIPGIELFGFVHIKWHLFPILFKVPLSPRLSLCPFTSLMLLTFESGVWAGGRKGEERAWASSSGLPGTQLPLSGPPHCF